jgi:hypothetical protein
MATKKRKAKKPSSTIQDELNPGFSTRSARAKTNNAKGKSFEREVANLFKPLYRGAKRSFGQSRTGAESPDVVGTPFWIECGKGSTIAIHEKLAQGQHDTAICLDPAYRDRPVVAVTKSVRGQLMVTMTGDDFVRLIQLGQQRKLERRDTPRPDWYL